MKKKMTIEINVPFKFCTECPKLVEEKFGEERFCYHGDICENAVNLALTALELKNE